VSSSLGRRAVLAASAALTLALGLAGCGAASTDGAAPVAPAIAVDPAIDVPEDVRRDGLDVAAYLEYPPYSYVGEDGEQAGFELEMARAVAAKMGVEVRFHPVEFTAIITGMANGRYDWSLGTMNDTAERREIVDFLDWSRNQMMVQVRAGNPHGVDPNDLCGVAFGHVDGSANAQAVDDLAAACAAAGKPAPTQMLFQDVGSQLQALRNDRFAADLQDPAAGATTTRETNGDLVMIEQQVPGLPVADAGWVFPKGSTALEHAVLQSIDSLIADGTWGRIMDENGMSASAILPPTLNQQRPEL
jgi:polar amino acid transport system substrate-binding protein